MSSKSFEWTIERTKILISMYEDNECLYNNVHSDYKNREIRQTIIAQIANHITEVSGKVCIVADVRKKINSLRSQYLAEKQKITKLKSEGSDYTPTVYWFPLLQFLDNTIDADASESNFDDMQTNYIQYTPEIEIHPIKRKKISRSSVDYDDADNKLTPQQFNNNNIDKFHITTFCNFVNSELASILDSSNIEFVKKAKRKIQMCLFEIWDEIPPKYVQNNSVVSDGGNVTVKDDH